MWRFATRLGFAYDVFGDGTTSIHGGWGLFNNKVGDLSYANGIRTNPPQYANPSISIYNAGTTLANFSYGPVVVLQSGQPFTVYTTAAFPSGDFNGDGYNYDVPNTPSFGNTKSTSRSDFLKGVFPANAFPHPATGTEGNLGRNTYNGPGLANTNLAAERMFKLPFLGEQGRFEVRGEILNLFNRVNLTTPSGNLASGVFGKSTNQNLPRQIQVVGRIRF